MNREAIYAGLFAQLSAIPGFATYSRLLRHWTEVVDAENPALFQAQGKETAINTTGQPTKWEMRLSLYVYVRTDGITPPATIMNPLLDAITNIVCGRDVATGTNRLSGTIPGLVWARVDGTIETDEGTLGNQAVAIIPVLLLATD